MNNAIQGLWIGSELSVMEQLSIASFLHNGHTYHLYVYGEVKNIPAGTVIKDANEILPRASIFQYTGSGSYAGFANFFRYKLLLERGGWWADTDIVCLKPFDFREDYVFASEKFKKDVLITCGVLKAPAGSEVMEFAWRVCQTKNPIDLIWGETGSKLMAEAIKKYSLQKYQKSHLVFCPLDYLEWSRVLEPAAEITFDETTCAIHLWNEMWRSAGQDKNASYLKQCLYEQLKQKYLSVNVLTHRATRPRP